MTDVPYGEREDCGDSAVGNYVGESGRGGEL